MADTNTNTNTNTQTETDITLNSLYFVNDENVSLADRVKAVSTLRAETIYKMFNDYEIHFTRNEITLYMIIKMLQHPFYANSFLHSKYTMLHFDHSITWFSNIEYVNLLEFNIKRLILHLKRRQKESLRCLELILNKSKTFRLSLDLVQRVCDHYLECDSENISIMVDKLGHFISILRNLKLTHIEYYYYVNVWERMIEQPNQQGAIEAEEQKRIFLDSYVPLVKMFKKNNTPVVQINGDFSRLYLGWCQFHY